jgi:uncharacterized membrane protein
MIFVVFYINPRTYRTNDKSTHTESTIALQLTTALQQSVLLLMAALMVDALGKMLFALLLMFPNVKRSLKECANTKPLLLKLFPAPGTL